METRNSLQLKEITLRNYGTIISVEKRGQKIIPAQRNPAWDQL